jgi:signal transduction histidine kinase
MTGNRWWHVLFIAAMLVLVVLAEGSDSFGAANRIGAFVCLGLITVAYATLGWRTLRNGRFATLFVVILIVLSGAAVSFHPSMATIQAIAFPLIWFVIEDTRRAIIANVALAVAVGVGYVIVRGPTLDNIREAVTIEGISLVGSLALGLWFTRVATRSDERQRLLDELTATQDQLALLSREAGATGERERLAREIHDTVAQSLTGMVMLAQQARRNLDAGNLDAVGDELSTLETSARDALVETRTLVAAGAPVELGAGVIAALERVAARFARDTGIPVSVRVDVAVPLPRDVEVVLLRSAQEGLTNVRKHSATAEAWLDLEADAGEVRLTVRDDGVGFDPAAPSVGFGLTGMRDRVQLAGGHLTVTSAPGSATTLTVVLPLLAPAASIPASTPPPARPIPASEAPAPLVTPALTDGTQP